ncbi:MAG: N-6 DNA methylase [Solirubrobacterales bacterium]
MAGSRSEGWIEELSLTNRRPPELYLASGDVAGSPHAAALRVALGELGLSAVLCVSSVPTVGFLVGDDVPEGEIDRVHRALWNQGLMGLLVVVSSDAIRAYSLSKLPGSASGEEGADRRLVVTFSRVLDALRVRDIVLSVESGRWWLDHVQYHGREERVDQVLLSNLMSSYAALKRSGLAPLAAQAILMQVMFIAYLEDRGIVSEQYFRSATGSRFGTFSEVLVSGRSDALDALFVQLRDHFNGGLFIAPCSFEQEDVRAPLTSDHLEVLARFRAGVEDMERRQLRLWGYDFRYIPVELLSSVYDRFLGENEEERRADGAYYTPMFLADMVVGKAWDAMSAAERENAAIKDPACGSGIFLVRMFQRLVEHERVKSGRPLDWPALLKVVNRIRGADINPSALRVAAFSLYIALLEQVTPPDIISLMERGHILPKLHGVTLMRRSFFGELDDAPGGEVLIGNPPWASRRRDPGGGLAWSAERGFPCPSDEVAWAFVWKAVKGRTANGLVAFLLPAMAFLHNHSRESVSARSRLFEEINVTAIVNMADLSFLLFDGADRPAALMMFRGELPERGRPYIFEYWCPKADMNLVGRQVICLTAADRNTLRSDAVIADGRILKRKLWARRPDEKLLGFLSGLPKAGDLIDEFENISRRKLSPRTGWVIGQGFKPASEKRLNDPEYSTKQCVDVTRYPHLETRSFTALAQPRMDSRPWPSATVHRAGFVDGFKGPHILIPQGVKRDEGRLRATYTEQDITFRDSIQAIRFPEADRPRAKLLTAILNSKLAAWYAFHQTANLGTDRAKVHQEELLDLPFPAPEDLPDPEKAYGVARQICDLIDAAQLGSDLPLLAGTSVSVDMVDELVYRYFDLTEAEVAIVDDTLKYIVPAMQPRDGDVPDIWRPARYENRSAYGNALAKALQEWVAPGKAVLVDLVASCADLGVVAVSVNAENKQQAYTESLSGDLEGLLTTAWQMLPSKMSGNFQMLPDLRIALCNKLYLFKPMTLRNWLSSTALSDADAIVADLHRARRHYPGQGTEAAE